VTEWLFYQTHRSITAEQARQIGGYCHRRDDWEDVRLHVMLRGLEAKFTQHPELFERLKSTAPHELRATGLGGDYWKTTPVNHEGGSSVCRNMLGNLLMIIRDTWTPKQHVIRFSGVSGENEFLSNRHPSKFIVDGTQFNSVEEFVQSRMFICKPMDRNKIKALPRHEIFPAMFFGDKELRPDWSSIQMHVMRVGLRAKFTQNMDLMAKLQDTSPNALIETDPTDNFWGIGEDGSGSNMLGQLLMAQREQGGVV